MWPPSERETLPSCPNKHSETPHRAQARRWLPCPLRPHSPSSDYCGLKSCIKHNQMHMSMKGTLLLNVDIHQRSILLVAPPALVSPSDRIDWKAESAVESLPFIRGRTLSASASTIFSVPTLRAIRIITKTRRKEDK